MTCDTTHFDSEEDYHRFSKRQTLLKTTVLSESYSELRMIILKLLMK